MKITELEKGEEYMLSNGSLGAFSAIGRGQRVVFLEREGGAMVKVRVIDDSTVARQMGARSEIGKTKRVPVNRLHKIQEVAA